MDLELRNVIAFKNTFDSDALEAHRALRERICNKDILDSLSSESLNELTELEDENGSTIFHFISENFCDFHKYFISVCKRKLPEERICEILLKKNLSGRSPFELSPDKHFFCNFIAKRMTIESLHLLVSSFCSAPITQFVDKRLNNFLHHLAKSYYGPYIIEAFLEFCSQSELKNLENALKAQNSNGDTPLHLLIERNNLPNVFQAILNAFGGKIFSIQDKWGCNIFHKISEITNRLIEEMVIKFCEENASNSEIRQAFVSAMNHGNFVDRIPLHDFMLNRKTKLFISMCDILTVEEMKTVFLIKDEDEKNIFNFMLEVYFEEPKRSKRPKRQKHNKSLNFFNGFYSHCQGHSSWMKEIFADGTELNRVLVLEESEGCYFAKCIRRILESQ